MYRYLYRNIDWDEHCIAIIVKTTFANKDEALFASLDNTWFANHTIFDLADEFYKFTTIPIGQKKSKTFTIAFQN